MYFQEDNFTESDFELTGDSHERIGENWGRVHISFAGSGLQLAAFVSV
jgi:hypothetical protein